MKPDLLIQMECWKEYEWANMTADGIVCRGPCFLTHIIITSDSGGVADAAVYDGIDTSGKLYTGMRCKDDDTEECTPSPPAYFRQGIYVDIGSNVENVMVQYIQDTTHPYKEVNLE